VKRQTVVAGAGIMMAAALLSRLLGWLRDRTIGSFWGVTEHTDAFWAAFMVPDLLYYLLAGGAVSAAIIPVFAGYVRRSEEAESWRVANTILTLYTICAVAGVILIVAFAPALVDVVAPGFPRELGPEQVAECAGYVRLLAPMVIFTVLSAFFTGILQAHRHFTAPAAAWVVYNFGIIGGAFAGGMYVNQYPSDPTGIKVLCIGVLVGAVLLAAVQLPGMLARGFRYRPALELGHPGVREVVRLFLPYMAGLTFTQICLFWFPSFFGSWFPGGVTVLRYANRLVVLPLGLFGVAISTAVFPTLAARVDAGEIGEFRRAFSATLRAVFVLAVPSAAGLFVLAGPVLRLLWKGGQFGESAIAAAEFSLLLYIFSLIGLSGLQIVNRALYSLKDTRTPPIVGFGYATLIVVLAIALMRTRLEYAAIAAATSIGVTVGLIALTECLRRRIGGIDGRAIAVSLVRVAVASLVLAAVAFLVSGWLGGRLGLDVTQFATRAPMVTDAGQDAVGASDGAGPAGRGSFAAVALQVLVSIAAGGVSYLLVLRLLGAPELETFVAVLRRRAAAEAVPPE
jgi:putative peptidoglycan lipid II flippase